MHTLFSWGNVKKRDHFEDLGVCGRVLLKRIFKILNGGGDMDWTDVTQNRDRWWAVVRGGNETSGSIKWGGGDFLTS